MSTPLNLVVLAAGLGSRFGGLKQLTPVDRWGHALIDFATFDAIRAGFGRLVVVVTPALEEEFHDRIGRRLATRAEVVYAHQTLDALPAGHAVPEGRAKPWGTAHAVLCAAARITGPFATINADDFYGPAAFGAVADFLRNHATERDHALVGHALHNTLSDHGEVSRGVAEVDGRGRLRAITEHTRIKRLPSGDVFSMAPDGPRPLDPQALVSLNLWGFHPAVLDTFRDLFPAFLDTVAADPLKAEYLLPSIPDHLVKTGAAQIQVLATPDRWHGVTYPGDLPEVEDAISRLRAQGAYPERLWDDA
ncbi:MAG: NTP transferase domain-containing protein [Propionibacteriaceae bacterium]|jgi:NDP-sugar pyrophosphorylase family protein|nr:NTP transferase domain-containing protein [Propionibacteriaceae bacterium]